MSDLIARLRTMSATGWHPIGNEAADEIDRLTRERNESLAAAEAAHERATHWTAEAARYHEERNEARAEREAMAKALLECATVETRLGDKELSDAIDNHGMPYQSQWLADLLAQIEQQRSEQAREG